MKLIKAFWDCGDNQIIEFAIMRAHLNQQEKLVVMHMLDGCMTQEQTAELMDCSTRKVQMLWTSAEKKLLSIPWVIAYAKELTISTD